ncbi:MAG: peptidase [Lachnospiraceae bacterium]|nr:peptidase [Lachnospiraceae bacterium]
MNQFNKIWRCGLALLAALAMVLGAGMTVSAASAASLDFDKAASVTLTLADSEGNTVSGGEITLYEVASLYLDDGNMAYSLTDPFLNCTVALDVTDTSLAAALAQYVKNNSISGTAAAVGANGTVTFSGLKLGLYLLVQTTASDSYLTINPFVVTLPMESDGVWSYAVDVSPKVGTVTRTEPEEPTEPDEPTEPEEPGEPTPETPSTTTLPQTGQLNWPVPVLAACGLILFAFGWILRCTDRKGKCA